MEWGSRRRRFRLARAAGLRPADGGAENRRVRDRARITTWAIAILGALLAGFPSYAALKEKPTEHRVPAPEARVDINHASIDELMKVPGMTRTWAGRIVRFRPYRAKTDLIGQGVVTGQVYDRIKDYVIAHRAPQ